MATNTSGVKGVNVQIIMDVLSIGYNAERTNEQRNVLWLVGCWKFVPEKILPQGRLDWSVFVDER